MGFTIAGVIFLILQVLSWFGNALNPNVYATYDVSGLSFAELLGSNISLIIAIICFIISYIKYKHSSDNYANDFHGLTCDKCGITKMSVERLSFKHGGAIEYSYLCPECRKKLEIQNENNKESNKG